MLPLAISDLPVFLRWRGEPPFRAAQWDQLVGIADRVIVDSSEWGELRYDELARGVRRDRGLRHRLGADGRAGGSTLAARWPAIATSEIEVRGPRAEAALLRGWLAPGSSVTVGRSSPQASSACGSTARSSIPARGVRCSPSDLLSAELDRLLRDRGLRGRGGGLRRAARQSRAI